MPKDMVPKRIFFTKGVGKHKERLTSFELALRDAGIAAQNLVRVSSIFPPQCKLLPRSQGLTYLSPGEVVFAVVAENSTHEPHRLLASSIGVAIPADRNTYGYLSEHHSFGETEDAAEDAHQPVLHVGQLRVGCGADSIDDGNRVHDVAACREVVRPAIYGIGKAVR